MANFYSVLKKNIKIIIFAMAGICFSGATANAERVSNGIAVFSGLDKITGKITSFEVPIGDTYQFGSLQVTPRACYTSGEDEAAYTDGFVEIKEITLDKKIKKIFSGWMFADSPGLNAVEHPVYDVWLKDCKQKRSVLK